MARYHQPQRELPVLGEYDVIVVGGGPAGCAAALSAERHGARTALVEKGGYLGGAAVSMLVSVVLSTNTVDLTATWHELMRGLIGLNGVNPFRKGIQRDYWYGTEYSPEDAKFVWDRLLLESGVTVLFHSHCFDAVVEDGKIAAIACATPGGNIALAGRRVIDCTGDGTIAAMAGVTWEMGSDESPIPQAHTKMVRIGNAWKPEDGYTPEMLETVRRRWQEAVDCGEYDAPQITSGFILRYLEGNGGKQLPHNQLILNTAKVIDTDPLDPVALSRGEIDGRAVARQCADFYTRFVPGCEEGYLLDTSSQMGVRASRRLRGIATVAQDDVLRLAKRNDGVARSSWEIDIHPSHAFGKDGKESSGSGTVSMSDGNPEYAAWLERVKHGDYFDVPYGALVSSEITNLLFAGRCISAAHAAQASLRIQQTCMATGEAAGAAAAMSVSSSVDPADLDANELRSALWEYRHVVPAFPGLSDPW